MVKAPPKQWPFTMAMVGLGNIRSMRSHHSLAMRRLMWRSASVSSTSWKYSLRSMPEQKAGGAPVTTSTRASRSRSTSVRTSIISRCISGFMALRFSGRFSTTVVTAPSFSMATVR